MLIARRIIIWHSHAWNITFPKLMKFIYLFICTVETEVSLYVAYSKHYHVLKQLTWRRELYIEYFWCYGRSVRSKIVKQMKAESTSCQLSLGMKPLKGFTLHGRFHFQTACSILRGLVSVKHKHMHGCSQHTHACIFNSRRECHF